MIPIKSPQEIEIMRQGGRILAEILNRVAKAVKPGITTNKLNKLAEELVFGYGSRFRRATSERTSESVLKPSFKGFRSYPATLCTSINEEIVHGLPSDRKLKQGDIIGLDLGVQFQGLHTDMAKTVPVGKVSPEAARLVKVAKKALDIGISKVRPGNHIGDISFAIQSYVEQEGFVVIRNLVGHGVGRKLHEPPQIPNFGEPGTGPVIKKGMCLALEPMVTKKGCNAKRGKDGFGFVTESGCYAAHFEHTVAVIDRGCEVLTLA